MGDIEVVTDQLRAAAKQIGAAAEGVAGTHPPDLLDPVGTALPGSASAGAAAVLAGSWSTRFSGWVTDARSQRLDLDASAASYDGSDRSAATAFAPRGPVRTQ
jgi:hypothetical protein